MLKLRLIFGSLLALAIFSLLLIDGMLARRAAELSSPVARWLSNGAICVAITLVFTLMATRELIRFAERSGHARSFPGVAYLFVAGLVIGPWVTFNLPTNSPLHNESWGMMWLAVALGLAFVIQAAYRRSEHAMVNLAVTIFIIFYAGGLGGYMTKLRMEVGGDRGTWVLLFSMFIVKMTDVGAYFTGRMLGRNKLIPWLSPGKTWEGLYGGILTAIVMAVAVGLPLHSSGAIYAQIGQTPPALTLMLLGLLMAVVAVAGDLFASLLKRDAALKDSGHSIPGMGGIMDVLDSPLLAAPAAWFFWTRIAG